MFGSAIARRSDDPLRNACLRKAIRIRRLGHAENLR